MRFFQRRPAVLAAAALPAPLYALPSCLAPQTQLYRAEGLDAVRFDALARPIDGVDVFELAIELTKSPSTTRSVQVASG